MIKKIRLKHADLTVEADDYGLLITGVQEDSDGHCLDIELEVGFRETLELIEFLNQWALLHLLELKNPNWIMDVNQIQAKLASEKDD